MKVLVFVKQIPDVNKISFDPETRRIVRENVPLQINPYDKRAVEEAVRIKEKIGAEVVVATMGPPQSAEILNDSLRMGSDRAILVTDRAFAGSDTLATSKILSRVVELEKPDLVLAGKYSLDGETSQVPPEIAVFSGYAFKSSISKIEIHPDLDGCIAEQEREDGFARFNVKFPAVLSVSEKINRARRVDRNSPDLYDRIEKYDAGKLGINFTGTDFSPTEVTGTDVIESSRKVKFLEPDENLFPEIERLVNENRKAGSAEKIINLPASAKDNSSIWGLALNDPSISLEIASKISEMAIENDLDVRVIGNIEPEKLDGILCHEYIHLKSRTNETIAEWISSQIRSERPRYIIFPSTLDGREISSAVAAKLELGLTADCIDLAIREGKLIQYKPAFGGGIVAAITSRTEPQMATVRPGMFRKYSGTASPRVITVEPEEAKSPEEIERIPVSSEYRPLGSSNVVIGIGMGIRKRENVPAVLELAGKLDASVGGTRPLVDFGFLPRQQQIGITGTSISPGVYFAIGISGKDNHVAGIRYAKKIIAVNRDREAPIFNYADFGIVMDAMEFVEKYSEYLSGRKQ